ncbi:MAG: polyphosphate kinase 2 [Mitsuaria chitosanitabida]|uniref:polyphosphate kinase 2 n=1 Tax=Roseateles chitosanitabidus TaxID=65048 RepID=UPI001AFE34FC|nr:polyphosphate kinase 2 [Roseateles chitosanitabidus]MBO9687688.1 polyphosphate kinase 2 [Roseateles chitosanitabidus]
MGDKKSDKAAKQGKAAKAARSAKADDHGKASGGNAKSNGNGHGNGRGKLSKADYYERLLPLQVELNNLARWLQHTGKRLLILMEGRDTAGKGGVINAISETLNPRQCHTVALGKPSERELGQWYFQRYVEHLPAAGEIVLFDRSWYNRAGVEAVMGFCTPDQVDAFLKQVPTFERLLVDDGILLFKYWLTVDQVHQEERFAERAIDPLKRWKLSPIDLESREHYEDYGRARDRMLEATHNKHAPWTLVDFNDQRRGRLTLIRHLLDHLPDVTVPPQEIEFPPLTRGPKKERFGGKLKPIDPAS